MVEPGFELTKRVRLCCSAPVCPTLASNQTRLSKRAARSGAERREYDSTTGSPMGQDNDGADLCIVRVSTRRNSQQRTIAEQTVPVNVQDVAPHRFRQEKKVSIAARFRPAICLLFSAARWLVAYFSGWFWASSASCFFSRSTPWAKVRL